MDSISASYFVWSFTCFQTRVYPVIIDSFHYSAIVLGQQFALSLEKAVKRIMFFILRREISTIKIKFLHKNQSIHKLSLTSCLISVLWQLFLWPFNTTLT